MKRRRNKETTADSARNLPSPRGETKEGGGGGEVRRTRWPSFPTESPARQDVSQCVALRYKKFVVLFLFLIWHRSFSCRHFSELCV